jgi:hypothetical protein
MREVQQIVPHLFEFDDAIGSVRNSHRGRRMNGLGLQIDSSRAGEAAVGDDRNERCGILHRLEEGGNTDPPAAKPNEP